MLCLHIDLVFPDEYENDALEEEEEFEQQPLLTKLEATIKEIHSITKNVYDRLMQIQDNFKKIIELSSQWENEPMYIREKITKHITFDDRLFELKISRYTNMKDASTKIQQLLKIDILLFHNVPIIDLNYGKI